MNKFEKGIITFLVVVSSLPLIADSLRVLLFGPYQGEDILVMWPVTFLSWIILGFAAMLAFMFRNP
jgi:hypothetical protein